MDKLVELLESLARGLRDLMSLGLLEREEAAGRVRLETLAEEDPDTIWRGFGVAALLVGVIFTLTMPLANGVDATFEAGTKLHGAVPPLLLGLLMTVVVSILVFSSIVERLAWRQPRRWVLLGIWMGALAPAAVGLALGYTVLSMSGRVDAERDPLLVGSVIGLGVGLCLVSLGWGLLRAALATRRYLRSLVCLKHDAGTPCPFWCRVWYGFVGWGFPALLFVALVALLMQ
ncbi:MAG TPA: hypothetical protein VGE01_04625 [Fimbriimonas sp.]